MSISSGIDPLLVLPAELMRDIVDRLNPNEIWSLRRLSKGYKRFLEDADIVKDALEQYEEHDPTDCVGAHTFDARLQRFKTHQSDIPNSVVLYKSDLLQYGRHVNAFARLKGKYLTHRWHRVTIWLMDLRTGVRQRFTNADGGLALSDQLLIYATETDLRWRALAGGPMTEIPPPGVLRGLTGLGHLVATYRTEPTALVTVYDARTSEVAHTMSLRPPEECHGSEAAMAMHGNHLVMVLSVAGEVTAPLGRPGVRLSPLCAALGRGEDFSQHSDGSYVIAYAIIITLGGSAKQVKLTWQACEACNTYGIEINPSGHADTFAVRLTSDDAIFSFHGLLTIDGQWTEVTRAPANNSVYWKGSIISKPVCPMPGWTTLTVDTATRRKGVMLCCHPTFNDNVCADLLINESYLIDWVGGPSADFHPYRFEDSSPSIPRVRATTSLWQPRHDVFYAWTRSIEGISFAAWRQRRASDQSLVRGLHYDVNNDDE